VRLCGGEGRLRWLVSTATESALPFKKLGGDKGDRGRRPRPPPMFEVLGFFRLLFLDGTEALETDDSLRSINSPPGIELVESGLCGADLPICLGGWGKAPMLTVFRSVLPGGNGPAGALSVVNVGTGGELACLELGR
jgi:hypothetical protein